MNPSNWEMCPGDKRKTLLTAGSLFIFFWVGWVPELPAQEPEAGNSFTSAEDVDAGAQIYRTQCANCHAVNGTGALGPDLTGVQFRHSSESSALFRVISLGVPGSPMVASRLSNKQIWQLIAFIRKRSEESSQQILPGSPVEGKRLFRGRGQCLSCHIINGEGGRLGPDLSDIGWRRSSRYLRDFVSRPNAQMGSNRQIFVDLYRRYWPITVIDRAGTVIEGVVLSEDTYSLQLMDRTEHLHSILKRDVREIQRAEHSAMPAYEERLASDELDHLIAYLCTLRRE